MNNATANVSVKCESPIANLTEMERELVSCAGEAGHDISPLANLTNSTVDAITNASGNISGWFGNPRVELDVPEPVKSFLDGLSTDKQRYDASFHAGKGFWDGFASGASDSMRYATHGFVDYVSDIIGSGRGKITIAAAIVGAAYWRYKHVRSLKEASESEIEYLLERRERFKRAVAEMSNGTENVGLKLANALECNIPGKGNVSVNGYSSGGQLDKIREALFYPNRERRKHERIISELGDDIRRYEALVTAYLGSKNVLATPIITRND